MLTILSKEVGREILVNLSVRIRYKFAHPTYPDAVHDFYGDNELDLTMRAIQEIAYAESCQRDGNWIEFVQWTGLTEEDMNAIKGEMIRLGWHIDMEEFYLPGGESCSSK